MYTHEITWYDIWVIDQAHGQYDQASMEISITVHSWTHLIYGLLTKREVNMAKYCQVFPSVRDDSQHPDFGRTSLLIRGFVTWQYNKYIARNNGQSLRLTGSGAISQRAIWFILCESLLVRLTSVGYLFFRSRRASGRFTRRKFYLPLP